MRFSGLVLRVLDHIDVIGRLEDANTSLTSRIDRLVQRLLQMQTVDHHDVGRGQCLDLLGRGFPTVRVDTVGHQHRHLGGIPHDLGDQCAEDRSAHHHRRALGSIGFGVTATGDHSQQ